MALTNAERKKKYLEKLKANGDFDNFKKKKAADEKLRRDRLSSGLENLPKAVREKTKRLKRAYNRRKVAEYRQRKKKDIDSSVGTSHHGSQIQTTNSSQVQAPYKTTSALSKAVAKVKRALPSTTEKKKVVVAKLLRSFDAKDIEDIVADKNIETKSTKGTTSNVIDLVKLFYERDDVSRISPNMKDSRKFVDPITGTKEVKQIRYLMYKLSDVYQMFVQHVRNGNDKNDPPVKLAKFCQLRPSHVKLVNSTPLDQCLCMYHTNYIMCCKAINQSLPQFPKYGAELETVILCENPKKDCWFRKCSKCPNAKDTLAAILKKSGKNKGTSVMWVQWKKNKETNRFEKGLEKGTLDNLLSYFLGLLPEFLKHCFIKRSQSASFQKDNEEVAEANGEVVSLQFDFAESYSCEAQDEIQSAHWNQATISLFTACLKLCQEIFPNAISSDDTTHTKYEIACYMFKIISKIPQTAKILKLWSDGPNSQFKNRYMAVLIKIFEKHFGIKIFWNFFATSHGKGSVDGIGAVVKNRVRRLVKSRNVIVNSSCDFAKAFNSENSVIEVVHMSESESKKIRDELKLDEIFNAAPPVPNVFSFHQLQIINDKIVGFTTSQEGYYYFERL